MSLKDSKFLKANKVNESIKNVSLTKLNLNEISDLNTNFLKNSTNGSRAISREIKISSCVTND